jgi:hypothetical protein
MDIMRTVLTTVETAFRLVQAHLDLKTLPGSYGMYCGQSSACGLIYVCLLFPDNQAGWPLSLSARAANRSLEYAL